MPSLAHDRAGSKQGGVLVRLLTQRLRPYRRWLLIIVVFQLAGTIAALYLPTLNADIIDGGVATGDTGYILRIGAWMLAVSVLQIVCSVIAVYFGARTAMSFGRDVRGALFARVGTFSAREVAHFGAPSLITRTTNDVQQVQMLVVMTSTMMIAAPIMAVGGVIMAIREDAGLSWLLVVSVPVLTGLIALIVSRMVPQFRLMQERLDTVNRVLREQIMGVRVVRAFVREPVETQRFGEANRRLTDTGLRAGRLMALIFPTVMLVLNVSSVAVLWFGGHRVAAGQMQVGSLTAFLNYLAQILMSMLMGTFMLMMIPRAAVCAERLTDVLDTQSSVVPPTRVLPRLTKTAGGGVEFRDVSFAYPGANAPVLRGISFAARTGKTTAIIGSTGAGKTTLLTLVPRLVDVTGGAVFVDGVDVRAQAMDELWVASATCRSAPTCSPGRSRPTCVTGLPRLPTSSCGGHSRSRRRANSSNGCPVGSTPGSRRAGPTSAVGSGSGSRSHAQSCGVRAYTCSTTRSPRLTPAPMRGCVPHCVRRPGTPPCSLSPSGCRASWTPTRSLCSTPARSSASAHTSNSWAVVPRMPKS